VTPTGDRNEFLPVIEPAPGFADRVMDRVARAEVLRATVAAEEQQATGLLVIGLALAGILAGALVVSLVLPPLLALRVTAYYALDWLRSVAHGASLPGPLLVLVTVAALWLACELAPLARAVRRARA
jgi:hypothetical protein